MRFDRALCVPLAAAALVMLMTTPARAQDVEIGASLASLSFGLDDDNELTTFGVPTSGFGLLNPAVYASFFLGSRFAVEPQIGLIVLSGGDETIHAINLTAQFDYFIKDRSESSPYVFATTGFIDRSGPDTNPVSVGVGGGYRMRVGDRLTFRFDGRYTHFTEDGGDALVFGVSIGGLLGR